MTTDSNERAPRRIVREREREKKTGCPTSSWYRLMSLGLAPKPVRLGGSAVGWYSDELDLWIEGRPKVDVVDLAEAKAQEEAAKVKAMAAKAKEAKEANAARKLRNERAPA